MVLLEAAIPIDPSTPPEIAAVIGCAVTTGIGAVVDTARVKPGESVVVIGAGGVGLSAVMGAALAEASPIIAADTQPAKLDLARLAGATDTVGPSELARRRREADRRRADHAFEAIGLRQTVELAVDIARPGGSVTLVGMTPQGERAGSTSTASSRTAR